MQKQSALEKNTYFNQIYDQTKGDIMALITAKCGNLADVEDILQETYTEIYNIIEKKGTDYIVYPKAFTEKIAAQKIYRYYRWLDRFKEKFVYKKEETEEVELDLTDLAVDTFEIETWMEEKELKKEIESFLQAKPQDIRKIFYLFYYMDKTIEQISILMDIKPSNVKNKIYRTLKEMRQRYQREEVSP